MPDNPLEGAANIKRRPKTNPDNAYIIRADVRTDNYVIPTWNPVSTGAKGTRIILKTVYIYEFYTNQELESSKNIERDSELSNEALMKYYNSGYRQFAQMTRHEKKRVDFGSYYQLELISYTVQKFNRDTCSIVVTRNNHQIRSAVPGYIDIWKHYCHGTVGTI